MEVLINRWLIMGNCNFESFGATLKTFLLQVSYLQHIISITFNLCTCCFSIICKVRFRWQHLLIALSFDTGIICSPLPLNRNLIELVCYRNSFLSVLSALLICILVPIKSWKNRHICMHSLF